MSHYLNPQFPPPDGAILDTEHPLAPAVCLLPNPAGNWVDWVQGGICSSQSTNFGAPLGPASAGGGVANAQTARIRAILGTGEFTVASLFYIVAVPGSSDALGVFQDTFYVSNSNNQGWGLFLNGGTGTGLGNAGYSLLLWHNAAPSVQSAAGGTISTGHHLLMGGHDPADTTQYALYVDGTRVGVVPKDFTPASSPQGMGIVYQTGAAKALPYMLYVWDRMLSAVDYASIQREPFPFFRLSMARTLIDMGAFTPLVIPYNPVGIGGGLVGHPASLVGNR